MKGTKRVLVSLAVGSFINLNISQAGMLDQALYNVVGQVTNAIGARLGDEIYYGSSRGHRRVRHHSVHHRRHKKRVVKKATVLMSDEKRIQKALKSLGFYQGPIDGEINSFQTRDAIKKMNITYGISQDAFLSPKVKDDLIYLGNLFDFDRKLISKENDKKSKAIKLQTALKINGFYFSKIDGVAGRGTKEAISKYKAANNLVADGKLNYEEEYRLISSAKDLNDKNIENTIASLKAIGLNNKGVNKLQVAQVPNTQVQQPVVNNQVQQQANMSTAVNQVQQPQAQMSPMSNQVQQRQTQVVPVNQQQVVKPVQQIQPKTQVVQQVPQQQNQQAITQPTQQVQQVPVQQVKTQPTQQANLQSNVQAQPTTQTASVAQQPTSSQQLQAGTAAQPNTIANTKQSTISENNVTKEEKSQNLQNSSTNDVVAKETPKEETTAPKEANATVSLKTSDKSKKVAQIIEEISK